MIIEYVVLHHTGGTDANPLADTSHHTGAMIKDWHIKGNGWSDIGYNFVIEKSGNIFIGRKVGTPGAHAVGRKPKKPEYGSMNGKSIGICMAGNFDATKPTVSQIEALHRLLQELFKQYPTIKEVIPHRWVDPKTCPGKNVSDKWVTDLINLKEVQKLDLSRVSNQELLQELTNRLK